MFIRCLLLVPLMLGLLVAVAEGQEPETIVPSKPIERQISGGEKHTYQIKLTRGQFLHARLDQVVIDLKISFAPPDGKQVLDVDLNRAGDPEEFSAEAETNGDYLLAVSASGSSAYHGSYTLRLEVRPETTAENKERIAAERLMIEGRGLLLANTRLAQQALDKVTRALVYWRKADERFWQARALFEIGNANIFLNRWDKVIEACQQGLSIIRELNHPALQTRLFIVLGIAFERTGRYEQARSYYEQALAAAREAKDPSSVARSLNSIGTSNVDVGRNEQAIGYFEQALNIFRQIGDERGEAGSLAGLGHVNLGLSRYEKAGEYYEQALAKSRSLKDRGSEASALTNLGNVYLSFSRNEKAIDYYEQALLIYRETGDRYLEAIALTNLSLANQNLSRYEKAIEEAENALRIAREINDPTTEPYSLDNLAKACIGLGRYERSINYSEQALIIYRSQKNRSGEAHSLERLGRGFSFMGRYEKAIEYVEQALAIYREINSRDSEAYALNALGDLYWKLSRYDKAIEYQLQAVRIFREVKNRAGEGLALSNVGLNFRYLGQYDKAIDYYEQALAIHREVKSRDDEAMTLNNLGTPYRLTGRPEKAIEYSEQALAITREIKNRYTEADALNDIGLAYYSLRNYDKATEFYDQSLAIYRDLKDQGNQVRTLKNLAKAESAQGNLVAARTHIEETLKISETVRAGVVSPESRASFLSSVQDAYQLYTDLLMRQHQAEPTKGFNALALEVSERQRARSLLDLLNESRTDVHQGVDVALVDREQRLRQELNARAQQLTKTNKPEDVASLKQVISQLETDLERAQADIRKASPHYAALTQPQPLKLKEIQQQLDPDTLLLEYALGEEHSYLWAISKDSLTSYELPKPEEIKQKTLQLNELLTARAAGERSESPGGRQQRLAEADAKLPGTAATLSQILLGPVASQLSNKRLLIVADAALLYIPFAMLPEPSIANSQLSVAQRKLQPLIVGHEIVSLPSASALAIQRAELAGRQLAPKQLAVIADPVFDRSDERVKSLNAASNEKEQVQPASFSDTRIIEHLSAKADDKSGVAMNKMLIPRLPFTREEANHLLALAPKTSSFSAVDFQASRATVLSGELSNYRYVHFATHGWLDSERPGLSAIVLSLIDEKGNAEDGFLRVNDIYNLKLPVELVVLSACETGLGKEIKGEGLIGMTRGFMYAGVARVVVSLWSVNDKATAELMTKFYEKMLKQNERPAAALRAAQVEMWKQKQWRSPYYWAAFTMQGEWR